MVRLGTCFTNYVRYSCRGRRILEGLERRKKYISPENNAGVWHGAGVKSGFIETFSGKKTKRFWKPNYHTQEYYSDLLDEKYKTTYTAKAMRQIDYMGGFDNYIMRTSDDELVSNFAIELKRRMETVQRMLDHGDKTLEEIKKDIAPHINDKHVAPHVEQNGRFYFDWYGRTRHQIHC